MHISSQQQLQHISSQQQVSAVSNTDDPLPDPTDYIPPDLPPLTKLNSMKALNSLKETRECVKRDMPGRFESHLQTYIESRNLRLQALLAGGQSVERRFSERHESRRSLLHEILLRARLGMWKALKATFEKAELGKMFKLRKRIAYSRYIKSCYIFFLMHIYHATNPKTLKPENPNPVVREQEKECS